MQSEDFLDQMEKETKVLMDITKKQFITLDNNILDTKSSPPQWSIVECFQHLNLTLNIYIPQMEEIVKQKTKYPRPEKNFSLGVLGKMAVHAMKPKPNKMIGFKMKTFSKLIPASSDINSEKVLQEFLSFQDLTIKIIHGLKDVNLRRPKIITAAGPILKMRIGDALHFMVAHNQRHILQAQKVLQIIQ